MVKVVDELVTATPFVAALAYILGLPGHKYRTSECPACPLEWDRKALSHQHFFTNIGVPLDAGNVTYVGMLFTVVCRVGGELPENWSDSCKTCRLSTTGNGLDSVRALSHQWAAAAKEKPEEAAKVKAAIIRVLLLQMQCAHSSVRFNEDCNHSNVGDILEAVGGVLHPWRPSVLKVSNAIKEIIKFGDSDANRVVTRLGDLARQCRNLMWHTWQDGSDDKTRTDAMLRTIRKGVAPRLPECRGKKCIVCEARTACKPADSLSYPSSPSLPGLRCKAAAPASGRRAETSAASNAAIKGPTWLQTPL